MPFMHANLRVGILILPAVQRLAINCQNKRCSDGRCNGDFAIISNADYPRTQFRQPRLAQAGESPAARLWHIACSCPATCPTEIASTTRTLRTRSPHRSGTPACVASTAELFRERPRRIPAWAAAAGGDRRRPTRKPTLSGPSVERDRANNEAAIKNSIGADK